MDTEHKKDEDAEESILSEEGTDDTLEIIPDNEDVSPDVIKALRLRLKKCVSEKQEYLDGWKRAQADYVNARKRDEEEKKEIIKFSNENLIQELIPILDSFEMAKSNKEAWESVSPAWRSGVEYIYKELITTLEHHGLTEIRPDNALFDPKQHEAIAYEQVTDPELDHRVIAVVQVGYHVNGKIIKAAKVKVGEYKVS